MSIAVLLSNVGTPDSPDVFSVRKYLQEFLTDPRVIELPRIIWLPILYGYILPFRSRRSAKLYQKIWTPQGSPLKVNLEHQAQKLEDYFKNFKNSKKKILIYGAMRYGNPSFESVMRDIKKNKHITQLLLLPLYPQYSGATTASAFDKTCSILKTWRHQPELRVINQYYQHPDYISAIAQSIQDFWQKKGKSQKLLFSFHGLPKKFIEKGDPYYHQCKITAKLVAQKISLSAHQWTVSFQSRLGRAEWLRPYTDQVLQQFPARNIKNVTVICPGFSSDCLETLQEIDQENREIFMQAGGEIFQYIPALNDSDNHIKFLAKLIHQAVYNWE